VVVLPAPTRHQRGRPVREAQLERDSRSAILVGNHTTHISYPWLMLGACIPTAIDELARGEGWLPLKRPPETMRLASWLDCLEGGS
jgi:hypothetical protein